MRLPVGCRVFFWLEYSGLISGLFIAAMVLLIGGLLAFLRGIFIAVRRLSIRLPHQHTIFKITKGDSMGNLQAIAVAIRTDDYALTVS